MRNYALLLHHVTNDYARSEKYFLKALHLDPEDESTRANFERLIAERDAAFSLT